MPAKLRVEICNWLANMQVRNTSSEQLEQSLIGRWAHWDPQPFRNGSGCDTWTWKQAYVLTVKGQQDIAVCTMFQVLQNQLQPNSRKVREQFGKVFEEKWAASMVQLTSSK